LADIVADLRRGTCCLVTADKGWTHLLFHDLRNRLRGVELGCDYINGRPDGADSPPNDVGVMLTAISQLRRAVRGQIKGVIIALPHLDVMTTSDGGWTNVSREVVPLLYEAPEAIFLGFRDPTLPLLPVVEKLFPKRYVVDRPYAEGGEEGTVPPTETTEPRAG
jgi:cell division protease FtsH